MILKTSGQVGSLVHLRFGSKCIRSNIPSPTKQSNNQDLNTFNVTKYNHVYKSLKKNVKNHALTCAHLHSNKFACPDL